MRNQLLNIAKELTSIGEEIASFGKKIIIFTTSINKAFTKRIMKELKNALDIDVSSFQKDLTDAEYEKIADKVIEKFRSKFQDLIDEKEK